MDPITIGNIVSGGIGLIGSLFGGSKAADERKKLNRYLDNAQSQNLSWYNANALSDYTQRADSQALIKNLRDNLSRQNKAAANTAVITGATPEAQAVQKEQSNKVISDTYGNLASMGQRWKDNITNTYLARNDSIDNQRIGMMRDSANSYENLMGNGLNMLSDSFSNIIGNYFGTKKT